MQYRIYPPGFDQSEVYFRLNYFTGPEIIVDGVLTKPGLLSEDPSKRLRDIANQIVLTKKNGTTVTATLEPRLFGLDIPKLFIGKEEVFITEPFKWWQLLWIALPICLVFVGGLLGGIAGAIAFVFNSRLLRLDLNRFIKVLCSILIVVGSFFFYVSLSVLFQGLFS